MTRQQLHRVQMVRAMETIARSINDEELFDAWLMNGVADGDINDETTDEEIYENYCADDIWFADLMATFARLMRYVTSDEEFDDDDLKKGNGMFYVDGVVSKKNW